MYMACIKTSVCFELLWRRKYSREDCGSEGWWKGEGEGEGEGEKDSEGEVGEVSTLTGLPTVVLRAA